MYQHGYALLMILEAPFTQKNCSFSQEERVFVNGRYELQHPMNVKLLMLL